MSTYIEQEYARTLEKENEFYRNEIERLKEEHQYTVSKISHEIRNPLTLINSSLQLIQTQHPEVSSYSFWSQTMEDIKDLRLLLDELSLLNNSHKLNLKDLDICRLLTSVAGSFDAAAREASITLETFIRSEPLLMKGDEVKLKEVFTNLLKNALDATSAHGRIRIQLQTGSDGLIIDISDTGCGIPEEYLSDLFTPFVTHKTKGTGLGLAISRQIIAAHGGELQVAATALLKGTTFRVSLPFF